MCTFGTRFFGINKIFNGFHIHILVAVGVYFDFWHLYQLVMHQSMVPEFLISWSEIKFFCLCLFLTAAPNAGEKKISFSYCSSDERGCGQRGDWGWMVWMLNRLEHLKKSSTKDFLLYEHEQQRMWEVLSKSLFVSEKRLILIHYFHFVRS